MSIAGREEIGVDQKPRCEARLFAGERPEPTPAVDGAMGDPGGDGDLTVGATNKLGPSQQCEENLQACRLEGATASGDGLLTCWALPLDENQQGRPVQESVARSIDELDASRPQG